jgi:hypothetical protein
MNRVSVRRLLAAASTHRVRGASRRGQALRFAPFPLCLSRRASEETDPAISSALDGLKVFPSLAGFSFSDSFPLRSLVLTQERRCRA